MLILPPATKQHSLLIIKYNGKGKTNELMGDQVISASLFESPKFTCFGKGIQKYDYAT